MMAKPEQLKEQQQKNLDTGMRLAQLSIDNSQRIIALQVEVARRLFQDALDGAQELSQAKDAQQALSLQTRHAQEMAQMTLDVLRQVSDITNSSRVELSHLMTEQLAGRGHSAVSSFQSLASGLPLHNSTLVDTLSQAMNTLTSAFDQFARASVTTFTPEARPQASQRRSRS
jgi:phasin family protein